MTKRTENTRKYYSNDAILDMYNNASTNYKMTIFLQNLSESELEDTKVLLWTHY